MESELPKRFHRFPRKIFCSQKELFVSRKTVFFPRRGVHCFPREISPSLKENTLPSQLQLAWKKQNVHGCSWYTKVQGLRLTFLLTNLVASDSFTSQNQFSTSQNFQAWFFFFFFLPRGELRKGRHFNFYIQFDTILIGLKISQNCRHDFIRYFRICCTSWVRMHFRLLEISFDGSELENHLKSWTVFRK